MYRKKAWSTRRLKRGRDAPDSSCKLEGCKLKRVCEMKKGIVNKESVQETHKRGRISDVVQRDPVAIRENVKKKRFDVERKRDKSYASWAEKILRDKGYSFEIRNPYNTQQVSVLNVDADLYHVDGDKTTMGVMHDLTICFNAGKSGAHILVNDYDYLPEVRKGVDKWLEMYKSDIEYRYIETVRGDILIEIK